MEEYFIIQRKRRRKKYIKRCTLIITTLIIINLIYQVYLNIDIYLPNAEEKETISVERASQTINEASQDEKTVVDIIERVNESVVGISKLKNTGNTIFLEEGSSKIGLGTGMIVSENGYILTNEHVSGEKYSSCYITLPSGKTYQGNVVWSDSNIDLAIVKINAQNLTYIDLGDSSLAKVGQTVYAIGNPIGFEFQRTVTSGIISAVERSIVLKEQEKSSYMDDLIQTDATINPGNSGGPLINTDGKVIGVNSVKITSAEGIGFAVPINSVKNVIQSFISTGKFEEAYLGIFAYDKNVIPYLDSNLQLENGIYVVHVNTNSPAMQYGIQKTDVLLEVDGIKLNKMCDLRSFIYTKRSKDKVTFKVLRNNRERNIEVTLNKKY